MDNGIYLLRQKIKTLLHSLHHLSKAIRIYLAILRKLISIKLAYVYRNSANDNRLISILKSICNFLLIYFPLFYVMRIIQRFSSIQPYYPVIDEIIQTTTRVIFTRSQRSGLQICLKFWQRTEDEICDERLIIRNDEYLIEGLAFNRKFAPYVYFGIATVKVSNDNKYIQRGPLIKDPLKEHLMPGERYALVMKTLKLDQRLDHQLVQKKVDVHFLARDISQMHSHLEQAPDSDIYGSPDRIAAKLSLNKDLFLDAIELLGSEYKKYIWISDCLKDACTTFSALFQRRCRDGHIKRCHGDLKVTNLWVQPYFVPYLRPKLLALDCIDFKPEFCIIDTLSDVAMLGIDIERLHPQEPELAKVFLSSYLSGMQENFEVVEPLLEYYLTEKAIVCSYVSILFDDQQNELGTKYLQIADIHAQRLRKLIDNVKRRQAEEFVYSS